MKRYFITLHIIIPLLFLFIPEIIYSQADIFNNENKTVSISHEPGFYSEPISLKISGSADAYYYTTDGSKPDTLAQKYVLPIDIEHTTVLKVSPVINRKLMDTVITGSYFIDFNTTFAVVSLSTDSMYLWDYATGIYRHYRQKWERPVYVEFFETDGKLVLSQDAGIKLFGGRTRKFSEKSLQIVARKEYGDKRFRYQFFPEKDIDKFKRLVLRTSGNDYKRTRFRDALITHLIANLDIDIQAYRPTILFINGRYWGIYNLREKINAYYLKSNRDANPDSTDILTLSGGREHGSSRTYRRMLSFIRYNDLAVDSNYQKLHQMMDIRNHINYRVTQIFICNKDKGNIRYWRASNLDGRFRWILYDTDGGFGASGQAHERFLQKNLMLDTVWFNKPWSTFLLRNLTRNKQFNTEFCNQIAHLLNTNLHTDTVIKKIEEFEQLLAPEIDRHLNRWRRSKKKWQGNVDFLKRFARKRPYYFRKHTMEYFQIPGMYKLSVQIEPSEAGFVSVHQNNRQKSFFNALYFKTLDLPIEAIPNNLYRFTGWQCNEKKHKQTDKQFLINTIKDSLFCRAVFKRKDASKYQDSIIFNEICFISKNENGGDWIELFNRSSQTIDISGWRFCDLWNSYTISEQMRIKPGEYIILPEVQKKFYSCFADSLQTIGSFDFGLNKEGETVLLLDRHDKLVCEFNYRITQWFDSIPNDTHDFTLCLKSPEVSCKNPENWIIENGFGTPAAINTKYKTEIRNRNLKAKKQQQFVFMIIAGVLFLAIVLFFIVRRKANT